MYSNICAINSGCIASGTVLVVAAGLTFYADRWGRDLRNASYLAPGSIFFSWESVGFGDRWCRAGGRRRRCRGRGRARRQRYDGVYEIFSKRLLTKYNLKFENLKSLTISYKRPKACKVENDNNAFSSMYLRVIKI